MSTIPIESWLKLAVELASMLLLAGLVGAYHLGRPMLRKRDES